MQGDLDKQRLEYYAKEVLQIEREIQEATLDLEAHQRKVNGISGFREYRNSIEEINVLSRHIPELEKRAILARSLFAAASGTLKPDESLQEPGRPLISFPVTQELLEVCRQIDLELIRRLRRNTSDLHSIDRRFFEKLVAELWIGFGFDVELTQATRDGGRDIIAIKSGFVEEKFLIECKRPEAGNVVGVRPVRELYGVKTSERATKAILATTSYFSKDAKLFLEANRWELEGKDFYGIISWLDHYISRSSNSLRQMPDGDDRR